MTRDHALLAQLARSVCMTAVSLRAQYASGPIPPEAMKLAIDELARVALSIDILICLRDTGDGHEPEMVPPPPPTPVTPVPAYEPEPADNITFLPPANVRRGSLQAFFEER